MSRDSSTRTGEQAANRDTDRLLLSIGRHAGVALLLLAFTAFALTAAETAFPAVLGQAVDAALRGHSGSSALGVAVALIVAMAVLDAFDELAMGATVARSTAWIRTHLVAHILALGPRATARVEPGDLVGRLVGNATATARAAPTAVRALANLIPSIGAPVGLALIDPWLCVTFLAGVPVLLVVVRTLARDAQGVAQSYLAAQGQIAGRLLDALKGVRTITAAGKLDDEAKRILGPLPELHRHGRGLWRVQMRIAAQNLLLVSLLEVAVLAVAGVELSRGRITPGQLVAASQYVLLGTAMMSVLSSLTNLAQARAAAARIGEVLRVPPPRRGSKRLPAGAGQLEFRSVSVAQAGRTVLRDVSLVIPPRALVALVGASGAGKSLLAALAGRLLDPDEGQVLLDGVPLVELDRAALRAAVGYGFERPSLIGDTVAEAIAFGVCAPTRQRIVEAATEARADDFIRRLPHRYATPLRDTPMSGGEAQRLGLARSFAHAGRLLILDDVAASLDTVTEHQISQVLLSGSLAGRTRLIVAHRMSMAARADFVVWLERGHVRATGAHRELWLEPDYRALFEPPAAGSTNGHAVANDRALTP